MKFGDGTGLMTERLRRGIRLWGVVTTVLIVTVAGAAGFALAQGNDGSIHACVKTNGEVRVIGGPDACKSNEQSLSWNRGGVSGREIVMGTHVNVDSGDQASGSASCPDDKVATGGGVDVGDGIIRATLVQSSPSGSQSWVATVRNEGSPGPGPVSFSVQVVCVDG